MSLLDNITAGLSGLGTVLSAVGQMEKGDAVLASGQQENEAAQFTAEQLRQNAGQAEASAQRAAETQDLNTKYVLSQGLAAAAAGGGGASDPTVVNLLARVAGEGAYRTATALYQGKDKARTLNEQADAAIYTGKMQLANAEATQSASDLSAFTTLLKGGASLYSKFAGSGPDTSTTEVA